MEKLSILGTIFLLINLAGFYLAYLYGRKTKIFKWREYFAIIFLPILSIIAFIFLIDSKVLVLFVLSALIGFALEYLAGLTYHKTLNKKLWEYNRFSVKEYTSLLAVPLWGVAGVIFWFLSKIIGL